MWTTALILLSLVAPEAETRTYKVGELDRKAIIASPLKGDRDIPVVFAFHGHGGNMRNAQRSFNLQPHWPEALMVYMEGIPTATPNDPQGKRNGWQVRAGLYGDRDLAFFDTVWKDVQKSFKIDKKRVYVMGHSNGGRFTYLLWAERGSIFAAAAPSGSPSSGLSLEPKPFFHIVGDKDPIVNPGNQHRSIEANKSLNSCEEKGTSKAKYLTVFESKTGNPAWVWDHPGGHEYPREALPFIAEFFKANPKK